MTLKRSVSRGFGDYRLQQKGMGTEKAKAANIISILRKAGCEEKRKKEDNRWCRGSWSPD